MYSSLQLDVRSPSMHPKQTQDAHPMLVQCRAMFVMFHKDVKYVDWLNLGAMNLRVRKSETRWKNFNKRQFPDDIVIKLATSLTM